MILIADSGSTKTDWRLINADKKIEQYKTSGINPYYQTEEVIIRVLKDELLPNIDKEVREINFYGAGCSAQANINVLNHAFKHVFPNGKANIHHDLLGAARSLCGTNSGIACIIGTGSNSCSYDGQKITDNIFSLGYILGDEGSGSWLGKRLINDYFGRTLPKNIELLVEGQLKITREDILDKVYKKPEPSKFLASFSKFIFQNINEPYFYRMVYEGFALFFEKNIMKYNDYEKMPVHFTGSVAYHYANILRKVAGDKGILVKNIVESPIAGLTLYHNNSLS